MQFLDETPRSLDLQIQRHSQKEFKEYHVGARIAAILANVNRDMDKHPEPFSELDFIPEHLWPDSLRDGPRFDKAGNVGVTNLRDMSGTEQQDFLFSMLGGPNAKSKRKGAGNLHRDRNGPAIG